MKKKTQRNHINKHFLTKKTLLFLFISAHNTQAFTKDYNTHKQLHIYSNSQKINMITNTLTITGNIFIQTNNINIYADTIIIKYSNHQKEEKTITAYGNPVIFYKLKNNKKQILATSSQILYKKSENIIILKGNAFLKQENYALYNECIIYIINDKCIATYHNNTDQSTKTTLIINKKT